MNQILERVDISKLEGLLRANWQIPAEKSIKIAVLSQEQDDQGQVCHLAIEWPADLDLPRRVVWKTRRGSPGEVNFYRAAMPTGLPVVGCLWAGVDATGSADLLLEDVSQSHEDTRDWPEPPPLQAGCELVEALAELHAACWNASSFGESRLSLPDHLQDQTAYLAYLDCLRRDFQVFSTRPGADAGEEQHEIFLKVINLLPELWDSFWKPCLGDGPLGLIHGDLNPGNVLYPRHVPGKVYLIDWEAYRRDLPAHDLAMLLGLHLCPDFDEALPFLHAYHRRLLRLGIQDYAFDDLLYEYEVALIFAMFYPLKLYAQFGILDLEMLQKALLALNTIRDAGF